MAKDQGAALDRKKLMGDPIMVTTIVVLIAFLTLFILYPLAILLVDSFVTESGPTLDVFARVLAMPSFTTAITNTLAVGFLVSVVSALVGLLFAYVEVYVKLKTRFMSGLFQVVSMLPVVSPPFVLSLSIIMLFGKSGIITRYLLGIYDNSVYGFWGIFVVQTLTFFPVCYMMLKGLLKNIDPSLEEAARDMGASRWKVFTSVTMPLILPGLGNAFLVTFIESIADFANPMIIGGSYDTLATTIYLQITGAYDKQGAAAMAVVLLCITLLMFVVQKYVLEAKSTATLSGKASRQRMLITDRSVRLPLTVACSLLAVFVIVMYLCVPFGALFKTWGYDFTPDDQVVPAGLRQVPRLPGVSRLVRALARGRAHNGDSLDDHLVPRGKEELQVQGLHRGRERCSPWRSPARSWVSATSAASPAASSTPASSRGSTGPRRC